MHYQVKFNEAILRQGLTKQTYGINKLAGIVKTKNRNQNLKKGGCKVSLLFIKTIINHE